MGMLSDNDIHSLGTAAQLSSARVQEQYGASCAVG